MNVRKFIPLILVMVALAGCGQKGDLYFPDQKSAAAPLLLN